MAQETGNDSLAWNTACEDTLRLLRQVVNWELPTSSWPAVTDALREVARAFADADEESLASANVLLEAWSPHRTTVKLGREVVTEPMPLPIREQAVAMSGRMEKSRGSGSAVESGTGAGTKKK